MFKYLIGLSFLLVSTQTAHAIGCTYEYASDSNKVTAMCKMVVDGKEYSSEASFHSSDFNSARSISCSRCRASLPTKLPKELQEKYRFPDGSYSLGLNGLNLPPAKEEKREPSGEEIKKGADKRVGESRSGEHVNCMRAGQYLYCEDHVVYVPAGKEEADKITNAVNKVYDGTRFPKPFTREYNAQIRDPSNADKDQ